MHFPKKNLYLFTFLHTLVEGDVYSMGFVCMRQLNIHIARVLSRLGLHFAGLLACLCLAWVSSFIDIKMLFSGRG